MHNNRMSTPKLEVYLYKLYVLCLPFFRLFDFPFGDFVNKILTQFSTYVMLLGTFLLVLRGGWKIYSRVKLFGRLYIFMTVASFIMSCVLSILLKNVWETPLRSFLPDAILYFIVLLSVIYNYYHLSFSIDSKELYRIFDIQILILLVVGYSQLGAMLGFGGPYSLLSKVFYLREVSWLVELDRGVTFFGMEPSSSATLCFIVIPYIFTSIRTSKGFLRLIYLMSLFLFLFLFLSSNSSQLLILFVAALLLYFYYILKHGFSKYLYFASFCLGLLFALAYLSTGSITTTFSDDNRSIEYALLGKIVDRENLSTATRASTVINDLKIIAEYPLTGVGNGNQGHFFKDNIPAWVQSSPEVQEHLMKHTVANGGGNFFPSYFSAFGLIGLLFLLGFVKEYTRNYKTSFLCSDERMNYIFQVGIILFLFSSWHVVGVKQVETVVFLLSLACVSKGFKKAL